MSPADLFGRRFDDWKRRLVDLSHRNRLLYFRPAAGFTMELVEPAADDIFVALYGDEKAWRIWEPPEDPADFAASDQKLGGSQVPSGRLPRERPRRADEIKLRALGRRSWKETLAGLRLRAQTAYEEAGLRLLHLAVGALAWREQDTGEEIVSPIILLPVDLRRDSRRAPYEVHPADEEPVINPALAIRLDRDFRQRLPDPPDSWEDTPPSAYLEKVARAVARHGWTVRADAYLSLFSFLKLVIYKDLEAHEAAISAHPVIGALVGQDTVSAGALPRPEELDERLDPRESYLIVDADSSQLAVLEALKQGHSIVVQGPPGTGKSQTITNVLAEMIAAGKSTLFVSEKMAALEVVRNRLKAAHLDHYCLELHSHKANKREVVKDLYQTLTRVREPRAPMSDEEYARLTRRRDALNAYVRELRRYREPLGRSVYEVLGELTKLQNAPSILWAPADAASLTPERLAETLDLARAVARVWFIALEEEFPWRGCLDAELNLAAQSFWLRTLGGARDATVQLRLAAEKLAMACGCAPPETPGDVEWLIGTARLLERTPGPPRHWLTDGETTPGAEEARRWQDFARTYETRRDGLLTQFRPEIFGLPEGLLGNLQRAGNSLRELLDAEPNQVTRDRRVLAAWMAATLASLDRWRDAATALLSTMGLGERPLTFQEIVRLARLGRIIASSDCPPPSWLESRACANVKTALDDLADFYQDLAAAHRSVSSEYDEAVLKLDVETLIQWFAGRYRSILRWFRPAYYRDRDLLRACRHDGKLPAEPLHDLIKLRGLLRLQGEVEPRRARWREVLAEADHGPSTDFGPGRRALAAAREILSLLADEHERTGLRAALAVGTVSRDVRVVAESLEQALAENDALMSTTASVLPINRVPGHQTPLRQLSLEVLANWLGEVQGALDVVAGSLGRLGAVAWEGTGENLAYDDGCRTLAELEAVRAMERTVANESERLRGAYGRFYQGLATAWPDVLYALDWTDTVRRHFATRPVPDRFADLAGGTPLAFPEIEVCAQALAEASRLYDVPAAHFEQREGGSRRPVDTGARWDDIHRSLDSLESRLWHLRDWIDFRTLRRTFAERGLASLFEALERDRVSTDLLVDTTRRALLQAWYEAQLGQSPPLHQFRGDDHQRLITEFRELDRRQWELGAHQVLRAANSRRPPIDFVEPGGELDTLRREYHKARRHLPVRQLIERIPALLRSLKPVIMMSPISASQFLPSSMTFDVVVFDEASQILPEDAVGSIYRGRQVVVCGDSKQLPPTDFFMAATADDDEDDEGAAEATDVFQSILEELAAARVPQAMLRWHYRSRHESLIAFSNQRFYDYDLVTFPAPGTSSYPLGIRFEFVPDGVYDRGRTRTNQKEAERAAALVVEHLRRWPTRTLGVVAFSERQRDAILQALDRLLEQSPELEECVRGDDRLGGFFVKNLENVQGDERDVMILSVGYGRDSTGAMSVGFGPLNRAGGERRLNVAVTRARDQVIVVSSIRAGDIDLTRTQSAGARLLWAYLDYAERGPAALALPPGISGGEPESPLEEDVAAAIRTLGYEAVHQVGCSRFRIDLGVISPAQPGRFILGVECDGATYHSAATARDRDRLRQEILERLGWRIHRVWSPDWVAFRAREVERLRRAIHAAEEALRRSVPLHAGNPGPGLVVEPPGQREIVIPPSDPDDLPPEILPYKTAKLSIGHVAPDSLRDPSNRVRLAELLKRVVEVEGPVHRDLAMRRIVDAYGIDRLGHRIENAINKAMKLAEGRGWLHRSGPYLYPPRLTRADKVRAPLEGDDASRREGALIPPDEIQLAVELVLKRAGCLERERLLVRLARIFGFDRLGENIRTHLERALKAGVMAGRFVIQDDQRVALGG